MNDESAFRVVLIVGWLILVPVLVYHRIRSQATGERLDRRQEGWFVLLTLVIRTTREEERLLARFGEAYQSYIHRTGRFLPRTRPPR